MTHAVFWPAHVLPGPRRLLTPGVAQAVLAKMKELMTANTSASSHSFLLDDDSSIPFQLDDIQGVIDDKVR